eukprot:TRINITY_DN9917_c0_g1_i1.p1 TRINITY_DN9917_c0_g1~~TRINITY_DN9917_c0_g1_i1.p1  ORF type:complete len:245 (+),score=28.44 TRINITY_DN9917_c0_g1_i1:18-752(+)
MIMALSINLRGLLLISLLSAVVLSSSLLVTTGAPVKPYVSFSFSSIVNLTSPLIDPNFFILFGYYQDYEATAILLEQYSTVFTDGYIYNLVNLNQGLDVSYNTTTSSCYWDCFHNTCCNGNNGTSRNKEARSKNSMLFKEDPKTGGVDACACTASSKIYPFWAYYKTATYIDECGAGQTLWGSPVSGMHFYLCYNEARQGPAWMALSQTPTENAFQNFTFVKWNGAKPDPSTFEIPSFCTCHPN